MANNFLRLASDDHATLASRPRLSFTAIQGLPPAWQHRDIGAVTIPGQASTLGASDALTYVVSGDGANIGGTADAFHFVHQDASGARTFTARLDAIESLPPQPKAGLMIRASTAPDAKNLFLGLSPTGGLVFHRRDFTGGGTTHVVNPLTALRPPLWLRLRREANLTTFTAFYSTDGVTWSPPLGTIELPGLPETLSYGLAVSSRSPGQTATAAFSQVGL
ncbi:MAG: hypothetical protein H7Z19_00400 [Chitinophagaceae bacterium]|nr:hypothetical protein [Rubrivivax sp.]